MNDRLSLADLATALTLEAQQQARYAAEAQELSNICRATAIAIRRLAKRRGVRGTLSQREQAILSMVVNGSSNKEIGTTLNVSERTAKFHVSNILAKHGAKTRRELIITNSAIAKTNT